MPSPRLNDKRWSIDLEKRIQEEHFADEAAYSKRYGFNPMAKAKFLRMDKFDRQRAIQMYKQNHGEPTRQKPYNYNALLFYANQAKERDEVDEFISLNPNAFNN